jgi:hypothetical protein
MQKRIALVIAAALASAAPTLAGVVYSAKTTGEGAKGAEVQSSTVRAWVSEGSAKVLFEASENPMTESGFHLISAMADRPLPGQPGRQTYAKWTSRRAAAHRRDRRWST